MLLIDLSGAAVVLLLCVQCLHGSALPAVSSYEFTAYRMQQYNLANQKHGKLRQLSPKLMERTLHHYIYSDSASTVRIKLILGLCSIAACLILLSCNLVLLLVISQ